MTIFLTKTPAQTIWTSRSRGVPPPRFRTSAANTVFYNIILYFYHAILARQLHLVSSDEFKIIYDNGVPNVYIGKYAAQWA